LVFEESAVWQLLEQIMPEMRCHVWRIEHRSKRSPVAVAT
jgi:hypothetical protein